MLDEFREQASTSPFIEEDVEEIYEEVKPARTTERRFLGMTAAQRFVIALMILMMTCFLGVLTLVVTEKIVPPIF
jgi:hypothetical protein